jgi:hypothetical protein
MTPPTPIDPKLTIEWLNRLVMMAQWPGKLPFHVVRLIGAPEQYEKFLLQAKTGTTDHTDATDPTADLKTAREKLLEAVAKWPSLKELFASDPHPFAGAPVEHLQLLAEVSDITTDPQRMVYSRNGTFVAIVEALQKSQDFEPEALVVDWLNKFFELLETEASIAEMLYNLAGESYWLIVLASLRDGRDYTGDEEPIVAQTLRDWQAKLTADFRALLFKPEHLSRAPAKLIQMAWNNQHLFAEARNSIPPDKRDQNPLEERKQVVNESLRLFKEKATGAYLEIEGDLIVLATVARHYINVRKFAKLDGFVYTWPDIARLAMSNYPALEYVEDLLVNRKPRPADTDLDTREARDLYELCARNDRLIRFLRLRPRFAEIDDDELRRYRPLAPVVITEASVQAAARGASGAADFPAAPAPEAPPAPAPAKPVENSYIEIVPDYGPDSTQQTYALSFSGVDYNYSGYKFGVPFVKVVEQVRAGVGGIASDNELQSVLRDLFASSMTQAEARLTRAGNVLLQQIFFPNMRSHYGSLLADNRPLRVVVESSEKEAHYLPWEWLPGFSPSQLFLSTPEHSLVRHLTPPRDSPKEEMPPSFVTPLKLMSIVPPAPVGQRFTSDNTIRALQSVVSGEPVDYLSLIRSEATPSKIVEELRSFQPKLVHFEGFLNTSTTDPEYIEFYFGQNNPVVSINAFAQDLKQNGVQLLVIGRNSMAQIYENLGAKAAFQLIKQGVPAVIAPMRAIDDALATTFTTEFYRAFLQGNTLESALHIARRKLAAKGGDWSVFALFANPAHLDHFQLLREPTFS